MNAHKALLAATLADIVGCSFEWSDRVVGMCT